jgi:hypothetical protein
MSQGSSGPPRSGLIQGGHKYGTEARKKGLRQLITQSKFSEFKKDCASKFDDAIKAAVGGNVEPLCKILWSDIPLSWDERATLATLLRRQLEAKKRGRPRGSADLSKRAQTKRYLLYLVRQSEDRWRRSHPGKQLPRGMRDRLISEHGERLADDGEDLTGISENAIRAELMRGRRR